MEEYKTQILSCYGSMLHNTGGPSSRVRIEPVKEPFIINAGVSIDYGLFQLSIPKDIFDIEEWLLKIAADEGLSGWKEISEQILLPVEKLIVLPVKDNMTYADESNRSWLKAALVLSKSSHYYYLPDGPAIFTRSRLDRSIRLLKIKLENFYELD